MATFQRITTSSLVRGKAMSNRSIDLNQFVIQHTVKTLGICSKAVENLLLGTAAAPSEQGIGVYGIDEATHQRIWDEYLAFDADLASKIRGLASQHEFLKEPHIELATNLAYATAIAWMIYQSSDVVLPHPDDVEGLAECWVTHFAKKSDNNGLKNAFIVAYMKDCHKKPGLAA